MTHPLTDEIIEEIAQFEPDLTDPLRLNRDHDMRAAYDLAVERCIELLNDSVGMLIIETEPKVSARYLESLQKEFIQDFKKAMRPQTQEDN